MINKTKQKPRGGSRKGCPNKATSNAREALAALIDGNADRLQGWLDEIAETQGAEKAFRCFLDMLEYHVPKLSRAELTGGGDKAEPIRVSINYVSPARKEKP